MRKILATAVLATALVPAVTAAQDAPDPDAPLSEQATAATKLRERADRWFAVGSTAGSVALASALVGVVYDDELREHPTADKAVVLGAGNGRAVTVAQLVVPQPTHPGSQRTARERDR